MTRKLATIFAIACMSIACTQGQKSPAGEFDYLYEGLPFQMEKVSRPVIPSRSVNILDFGGNGNGTFLITEAFAAAMDELSSRGGGHLVVPAGVWRTGPIEIKSNIDLHVEHGAVVVFDPSRELYPVIRTSFEGLETRRCESPLHAQDASNISITGGGTFDGSGESWRMVKKSKMNEGQWKRQLAMGGCLTPDGKTWYPDEGFLRAAQNANMNVPSDDMPDEQIKSFLRPVMVSLRNCENVLLEDCLFQNSPAWNIHPLMCKNLIIKNITVRNPEYSQNGDGIDIESCTNTVLVGSTFDCGDDGICIKSGKDEDGRKRGIPCSNLIVDGCTVYHGHGGFVVGSEMSGGVKNMKVSHCRFLGTDVGLRFKSRRGRGGVVEGIWISDITMTDIVTEALLFDLYYMNKSAVEAAESGAAAVEEPAFEVDETTPSFRDIHINNVVCAGAARAMYFNGLPEMPVKGIEVSDCEISSKKGIEIRWSEDVTLRNVNVVAADGKPLVTSNVKNIVTE